MFVGRLFLVWAFGVWLGFPAFAQYRKAVEGDEVVKNKHYPKSQRIYIQGMGGAIINPTFVDTIFFNAGIGYHFNEWHSLTLEGGITQVKDRSERACVETFFLNPDKASASDPSIVAPCDPEKAYTPNPGVTAENDPLRKKPAYVPIRQLKNTLALNYQYTPVYGKALILFSAVAYMDLFFLGGLGIGMGDYYPLKTLDSNDNGVSDNELTGASGRPTPTASSAPIIYLGLGNRFYFLKHMIFNFEIRNMSVIGTGGGNSQWSNILVLGGLGAMF